MVNCRYIYQYHGLFGWVLRTHSCEMVLFGLFPDPPFIPPKKEMVEFRYGERAGIHILRWHCFYISEPSSKRTLGWKITIFESKSSFIFSPDGNNWYLQSDGNKSCLKPPWLSKPKLRMPFGWNFSSTDLAQIRRGPVLCRVAIATASPPASRLDLFFCLFFFKGFLKDVSCDTPNSTQKF